MAFVPTQIEVEGVEIARLGVTLFVTVIVNVLLVAVVGAAQVAELVKMQYTVAPFVNVLELNVDPEATLLPFTYHWYEADPPLVAVGVKLTLFPAQIDVVFEASVTDGTKIGFTVIVIPLLVAVAGEGQRTLLVITTVTTSPLASVVDVKVALFVPAFTPFTFHW